MALSGVLWRVGFKVRVVSRNRIEPEVPYGWQAAHETILAMPLFSERVTVQESFMLKKRVRLQGLNPLFVWRYCSQPRNFLPSLTLERQRGCYSSRSKTYGG